MSVGYTTEALRREIRQNVEPAWGLSINNIVNPELVDNKGEMHDCYVAPGAKLSIGEGSVVAGSRLLGDVTIGKNCKVVNVEILCNATFGDGCEINNSCIGVVNAPGVSAKEIVRSVVFGDDCHIHDTVFETYMADGLSLRFGDRAYIKVGKLQYHGQATRFGDDCCVLARMLELGNSVHAGDRICMKSEGGSLTYQGRLKPGGADIRIGNDVRIVGCMSINASKRCVIGDRTLLNAPTKGCSRTLTLVEFITGTEAVVVVDSDFPRSHVKSGKIKVGSRGRLELSYCGTANYHEGGAEEVVVASNDSLVVDM